MSPEQLRKRMTAFAIDTVNFCKPLWLKPETRYIADQLCRASTSTASNYRIACRGRSKREFISKLGIALEEADESVGWYEVIEGAKFAGPHNSPGRKQKLKISDLRLKIHCRSVDFRLDIPGGRDRPDQMTNRQSAI